MHPQHPQPAPRKKSHGCLITSIVGVALLGLAGFGGCAAIVAGAPDQTTAPTAKSTGGYQGSDKPSHSAKPKAAPKVKFKVSGDAPAGVDIMYGSDSDNRQGGSDLPWHATLKRAKGAMWYSVTAQLQGGGDITCSVTIGDHTEKGHASGSFNICSAQINAPLSGWSSSMAGTQAHDDGLWQRIGARVAADGEAARR